MSNVTSRVVQRARQSTACGDASAALFEQIQHRLAQRRIGVDERTRLLAVAAELDLDGGSQQRETLVDVGDEVVDATAGRRVIARRGGVAEPAQDVFAQLDLFDDQIEFPSLVRCARPLASRSRSPRCC